MTLERKRGIEANAQNYFVSSSDLSVPITELVRMVKLYSTPWETKSAALKKLHEDYEKLVL